MTTCTKKDFDAYEKLRQKGSINMLDVERGTKLSGLSQEKYVEIIKNYSVYKQKYYSNRCSKK